ncbi:uncharacterized protein [Ptychodera flava]|uniref:uncharacterized protein n=1 Tax=Ptychodera flava TaxID=63121 RepID=UPI00396A6E12
MADLQQTNAGARGHPHRRKRKRGPQKRASKRMDTCTKVDLKQSDLGSYYSINQEFSEESDSAEDVLLSTDAAADGDVPHSKQKVGLTEGTANSDEMLRVFDVKTLNAVLKSLSLCKGCSVGFLSLQEVSTHGWGSHFTVACSNTECPDRKRKTQLVFPTSQKTGRCFQINRKMVLGLRAIGRGRRAAKKFSSFLGLPPPLSSNPFREHVNELANKSEEVTEEHMEQAVAEVRQVVLGQDPDDGRTVDVAVSVDGSWVSRSFSSLYGFVSVISIDTGKVLDRHVSSSYCRECQKMEDEPRDFRFMEWFLEHEPKCKINHDGSAKSMEEAGAVVLFERSRGKNNLRYAQYIGDGIVQHIVQSKMCMQMMAFKCRKRTVLATYKRGWERILRKLVDKYKGGKLEDGKSLTGQHRLTNQMINAFQVFYGIALRNNKGNVHLMSKQTKAIVLHYSSTHDEPHHEYCPQGADSWCKWQKDRVSGKKTYKPLLHPLAPAVVKAVQPVIDKLANEKLLEGVKNCYTQNQNESLHHVLWNVIPKDQNHGVDDVVLGANIAVSCFNAGFTTLGTDLCSTSQLNINSMMTSMWYGLDHMRVRDSVYKSAATVKKRRKENKRKRLQKLDKFQYAEGRTYESGGFDCSAVRKPISDVRNVTNR